MLTKNFLKRARKSGFWPTFYHSLRLQEKLYHIWCIILHCIIDQSFKQISPHLKEYSMEIHPKWGQGGCFHASMPSDIIFTLNFSFANSVIPLPQGFLYSFLLFLDTDIALQIIYKVISVFPKTLRYWVCHFHCNKIKIKKMNNYS